VITRLAPTPSGFLHIGNCVNLTLVDWLARSHGGHVVLRIDDIDADRYRPEYVDDIFRVLDMLGVQWQGGPRSRPEFETSYAMRDKTQYYRAEAMSLHEAGLAYVCTCSRAELRAAGSRTCVRNCREGNLRLQPGAAALRMRVPPGAAVETDGHIINIDRAMGDFVIWRRDDQPSFQLASVIEDRDMKVTHVVRGEDLLASTAAQLFLAPSVNASTFTDARFIHHRLVTDPEGRKLSKSQLAADPIPGTATVLEQIRTLAYEVGEPVGIAPPA